MNKFKLKSKFRPAGDQPKAIEGLIKSLAAGHRYQTLLGVTGSGKTFTMANIIEHFQKPTLLFPTTKLWPRNWPRNSRNFFRITPCIILFPITITTSRKPIFPAVILT